MGLEQWQPAREVGRASGEFRLWSYLAGDSDGLALRSHLSRQEQGHLNGVLARACMSFSSSWLKYEGA